MVEKITKKKKGEENTRDSAGLHIILLHKSKEEIEYYRKRSRLRNGSLKICAQTGSIVSDVTKVDPQSLNELERSFSALLYVS